MNWCAGWPANPAPPADEAILDARFAACFPGGRPAKRLPICAAPCRFLAGLTTLQLREAMLDCNLQRFSAGEMVFRRGDYTNSLWAIAEGAATVLLDESKPDAGIYAGCR